MRSQAYNSLLDANPPDWWKKRGDELADVVRYPATDSVKEWADEILALDQLVVEGFLLKPLRKLAEEKGHKVETNWGSLRALQEVLESNGHTGDGAKALVLPLQKLHALRTDVRGHATVNKKKEAESKARSDFGTLRAQFKYLVAECESTFNAVVASLGVDLKLRS